MKKLSLWIVVILSAVVVNTASAAMLIRGYSAAKHDRFYGEGEEFIGDPYNWSGVGRTDSDNGWATMVSSHYFVSAAHFNPSGTLRFYDTNDPSGDYEEHTIVSGERIGGSDLWLGKIGTTAGVSADVEIYPILKLANHSDYNDLVIYNFGKSNTTPEQTNMRLGRNQIDPDSIIQRTDEDNHTGWSFTFDYDFPTGGVGDDETYLQGHDSGGPSFAIHNGAPALVGVHWASQFVPGYGYVSYDTFVPEYISALNAAMDNESVEVVPEPAALVMLLGALAAYLCWRKLHRSG